MHKVAVTVYRYSTLRSKRLAFCTPTVANYYCKVTLIFRIKVTYVTVVFVYLRVISVYTSFTLRYTNITVTIYNERHE